MQHVVPVAILLAIALAAYNMRPDEQTPEWMVWLFRLGCGIGAVAIMLQWGMLR